MAADEANRKAAEAVAAMEVAGAADVAETSEAVAAAADDATVTDTNPGLVSATDPKLVRTWSTDDSPSP